MWIVTYRALREQLARGVSRKREKQRDDRRELARQLGGVVDADLADTLRSHARVTQPALDAALTLHAVKRGLLSRAQPLALQVSTFVVDASGARLAVARRWQAAATRSLGNIALVKTHDAGDDTLRYTRPAHFIIVVLLTEGADNDDAARCWTTLCDPQACVVDGSVTIDTAALRTITSARATTLHARGDVAALGNAAAFCASALFSVSGVGRVDDTVAVPLLSADGKLNATVALRVRF